MDTRKTMGFFINVLLVAAILIGMAAVSLPQPVLARVIYVNDDAPGLTNDGSSWPSAYRDLKNAVAAAVSGDQVWVAAGTYWIAGGGDTLTLKNGVEIYGGFAGTESVLTGRNPDPATNGTKISGSGLTNHVVTASADTDSSCILDGFTVTGGNAKYAAPADSNRGGGMIVFGSPTLANLLIYKNEASRAGGMYIKGGSPTMTNIVFDGNEAGFSAGGLAIHNSSPTMDNITFRNNKAFSGSEGGGGMLVAGGSPTLTNAVFSGNSAPSGGGLTLMPVSPFSGEPGDTDPILPTSLALTNVVFAGNTVGLNGGGADITGGVVTLTNVTFTGNHANGYGGGLFVENPSDIFTSSSGSYTGSVTVVNAIFWSNTAGYGNPQLGGRTGLGANISVSYSDVQGSGGSSDWSLDIVDSGHNIDAFPFINSGDMEIPGDVDWDGSDDIFGTWDDGIRLAVGSPAVDAGNNAAVSGVATDILGNPRIQDGDSNGTDIVDMGAYESEPSLTGVIYVDLSATGADNGSSWADAFTDLQHALLVAEADDTTEVWVAAGVYLPTVGTDRAGTFQPRNGVKIYGGFAGYENDLEQRNPATNVTILSGDLKGDDDSGFANRGDNSYHVVSACGFVDASAVLDGFTIRGGNADSFTSDPRNIYGGGLYNTGSPTLANLNIDDNIAKNGGGMYINGGNPTLTSVTFNGNHGENEGGGIFLISGNPMLKNVTLKNNDCIVGDGGGSGGGMFVGDYNMNTPYAGNLILSNVVFKDNAAQNGGGLQVLSGNVSLSNVTFSGNRATYWGGGMIVGEISIGCPFKTNVTLADVAFLGNSAAEFGGGMLIYDGSSMLTITLTNVLFSGNLSPTSGGGIALMATNPTLTNTTFTGNKAATGGALYGSQSSPTITNSIFWGDAGGEIVTEHGGSASVSYSIVQGGYTGEGNLNADPLFVSPPDAGDAPTINGDLHVPVDSPAIDAGNNAAPGLTDIIFDLDGNDRIVDGDEDGTATVDMGVYEFQGVIRHTVTFAAGANGTLSGTTSFPNILTGTDWSTAVTTVPTPVPNTGYTFDGWTPAFPSTVTASATYTASFVKDNAQWFTVTFAAGDNGTLSGTTSFPNILTGTAWSTCSNNRSRPRCPIPDTRLTAGPRPSRPRSPPAQPIRPTSS
jgi:predicted outer membrane repeat protein